MSTHYRPNATQLREIVPAVTSWRQLALQLGLTYPSSSIYRTVRPFCRANGIDCSHFTGQACNRGKSFPEQRTDIHLYLSNELPIASHALKKRLFQEGLKEHRCEVCKRTEWNGQLIPIQLHHLDGNSSNNALDNLQIACPNCHAQTPNYCAKNKNRKAKSREDWISDEEILKTIPSVLTMAQLLRVLGLSLAQAHYKRVNLLMAKHPEVGFKSKPAPKVSSNPYWRLGPKPDQRKYTRPSREELEKMVWERPSQQVATALGIGDTLLCRWCRDYGVAKPPRGYWSKKMAAERKLAGPDGNAPSSPT